MGVVTKVGNLIVLVAKCQLSVYGMLKSLVRANESPCQNVYIRIGGEKGRVEESGRKEF